MHSFPKPRIPLHPVISFRARKKVDPNIPRPSAVTDAGHVEYTTSGRASIARAFQKLNLRPPFTVLMPAYHCTAMVAPVIWAGGTPVFYKIHADLSVNLDDLKTKLNSSTRVLLITHYFGFPQDTVRIRAFCDANNLVLIEDCAHTFFGSEGGGPIGSLGHFAIASPWKFFPCFDGGCLVTAGAADTAHSLVTAGRGFELKAAANAIENALHYGRLKAVSWLIRPLLNAKDMLWGWLRRNPQRAQPANAAMEGGLAFEPFWVDKRMSHFSRTVLRFADYRHIARTRRQNYLRLEEALKALPGCRPLLPKLRDGVVPYVFPLLVDEPHKVFADLKQQGVPILRFGEILWQGVDESICPLSTDYSRRVFQFPCHQELTRDEIEWMIERVTEAFTKAAQQRVRVA